MKKEHIKALIFDFGGTLDYDGKNWGTRLYSMFKDTTFPINRTDFFAACEKAMDLLYSDRRSMTMTYKETIDVYIFWVMKYLDLTIENYKHTLVDPFLNDSHKTLIKNKNIVSQLADNYTLGVLSNNFGNCRGWCTEFALDTYFNIIIDSTEVNIKKPNLKIFSLAAEQLNLKPEECVYIGDKYEVDIIPPQKLGMHVIWLNSTDEIQNDALRIKELDELLIMFQ